MGHNNMLMTRVTLDLASKARDALRASIIQEIAEMTGHAAGWLETLSDADLNYLDELTRDHNLLSVTATIKICQGLLGQAEEPIDWLAASIQDEIAADEALAALGEYGGEQWGADKNFRDYTRRVELPDEIDAADWGAETITKPVPPLSPRVRALANRLNAENMQIEFGIGRVPDTVA